MQLVYSHELINEVHAQGIYVIKVSCSTVDSNVEKFSFLAFIIINISIVYFLQSAYFLRQLWTICREACSSATTTTGFSL